MKIYYPELKEKVKLNFINYNNENLIQPYPGLDFFYLKLDKLNNLHIPSNTQLSEFLNKFNENDILPKLGERKLEDLKLERGEKLPSLELIVNDFGWNWINWNSNKGKKVLENLKKINKRDESIWTNIDKATKDILGRIKLKESTDYGIKVESSFNNYLLKDDDNFADYSQEVKDIYDLLINKDLVVISFKNKFLHPNGIFWGEIDYILMNKKTKKIHLADLKTSYAADNYDYWRQLAIYLKVFKELNKHLAKHISDDLYIIHVSKMNNRNSKTLYKKNINEDNLNYFVDSAIELKNNYINQLKTWNKRS